MDKINIKVKLENSDTPYNYSGIAYINKDIIEYTDKDYHYIFDKTVKRLVKSNDKTTLVIDFNNKEIKIIEKDKELNMKIEIKKCLINENNVDIVYKVDKNDIRFQINEVK